MKTIETTIVVDAEHRATLQLSEDVTPGSYRVVLVIEEGKTPSPKPWSMEDFPSHDLGPWPYAPDETFRREDLYGDDGR